MGMMRSWAEVLSELERVDFELELCADAGIALAWQERRARTIDELSEMEIAGLGNAEVVRLAQAMERGRRLLRDGVNARERLQTDAEDLYKTQLLLRALAPERRSSLVNLRV